MTSPVFTNFLSPPSLDMKYKHQTSHVQPIDTITFLLTGIMGFILDFSPLPPKRWRESVMDSYGLNFFIIWCPKIKLP